MSNAIYWPMIAQATLTAVVAVRMYRRRVAEIRGRRIELQALATRQGAEAALEDVTAADNYRNLFEAPVLFFVVCLALAVTGTTTVPQLVLAWGYVALRALHSYIHLTYNRVLHRFLAFVASGIVLAAMWALFGLSLLGGALGD